MTIWSSLTGRLVEDAELLPTVAPLLDTTLGDAVMLAVGILRALAAVAGEVLLVLAVDAVLPASGLGAAAFGSPPLGTTPWRLLRQLEPGVR